MQTGESKSNISNKEFYKLIKFVKYSYKRLASYIDSETNFHMIYDILKDTNNNEVREHGMNFLSLCVLLVRYCKEDHFEKKNLITQNLCEIIKVLDRLNQKHQENDVFDLINCLLKLQHELLNSFAKMKTLQSIDKSSLMKKRKILSKEMHESNTNEQALEFDTTKLDLEELKKSKLKQNCRYTTNSKVRIISAIELKEVTIKRESSKYLNDCNIENNSIDHMSFIQYSYDTKAPNNSPNNLHSSLSWNDSLVFHEFTYNDTLFSNKLLQTIEDLQSKEEKKDTTVKKQVKFNLRSSSSPYR